jgi:hypothetical protein
MPTKLQRRKERAAELRIHSMHNILTRYQVAHPAQKMPPGITFHAATTGMASMSARFRVVRPGFRTDPDPGGATLDYGQKTFLVYGREHRSEAQGNAVEWATARYKIEGGWTKVPVVRSSPYDLIPQFVADWFLALLDGE